MSQNNEKITRTEYSAKNTTMAMVSRVMAIIMGYATRMVFIHTLSHDYVGVNGLFTDLINVLCLTELGLGTAITFSLYKPIADNDTEKIKSIMILYKKLYSLVALIVSVLGICVIPFFDILMKNQPNVDHIIGIYLLYLSSTVISYLLVYKRTLIDANQLSYINSFYYTVVYLTQYILQIIVLILTHNFILYLILNILATLTLNLLMSRKADRLYPYLKDKDIQPLAVEDKTTIRKNIGAMMMHKIGTVVVDNTDNLIMSSFIGVNEVGTYSNYYLIIASVRQIFNQAFAALTASVGNLAVTSDNKTVKKIFESTSFIGQWIYGLAAVTVFEIINPLVELSFGKSYLFSESIVFILCINFFIRGLCQATLTFRDSIGLFWIDRYKSVAEAIINLVVSIILVQYLGIIGIFLGTLISTLTTTFWVEPIVFYKHIKESSFHYFVMMAVYIIVWAGLFLLTDYLCNMCPCNNLILTMLVRFGICMCLLNPALLLIYYRTTEFATLKEKLILLLNKIKK